MLKSRIKECMNSPLYIFGCLILGIIMSLLFPSFMRKMSFIGEIYLKFLEMCVEPLIFLSVLCSGISFVPNRIEKKVGLFFKYWFSVAVCLAAIGIIIASLWSVEVNKSNNLVDYKGISQISMSELFTDIIPDNIVGAFLSENILQLIVLGVLVSVAIRKLEKTEKIKISNCLNVMYAIQKEMISLLVKALPIGLFFLTVKITGNDDAVKLKGIAHMVIAIYIGYLVAFGIIYPIIIRKGLQENIRKFGRRFYNAILVSFVSCSSSAAFPLVLRSVNEDKTKDEGISGIALLLKHANCLQTPIYCIFIAKMSGIPISFTLLVVSSIFGVFSSIGTAGIPSGGVVMIAVVFKMLGLPLEYVPIIAGIYVIVDMPGTALNVLDDCIGLTLIKNKEIKENRI